MTITLPSMKNWITTLGGILSGIPAIVLAAAMTSHLTLSPTWTFILAIVSGVGMMLVGFGAKDANTHSTAAEVQASTAKVAASELPKT
jgi:hypothetical protein